MSKLIPGILVMCWLWLGVSVQAAQEPQTLESGKSIEREIGNGESHTYQISLTAGQFMRVVVEQKGIDVALALIAPDSKQTAEADFTGTFGQESLSHEVAVSGSYQIVVRASGETAVKGKYEVRMELKSGTTAQDRQRIAAERLLVEANWLSDQLPFDLAKTTEKELQALSLWRGLGDRYWEAYTLHLIGYAYITASKSDQAIEYLEQSLAICREVKDRPGEARSLYRLGWANYWLGSNQKAIEFLGQALVVYRNVGDREWEASTLSGLGTFNNRVSHYEKVIEYSEQALAISRELKFRYGIGSSLSNLGNAYSHLGRYDKAIEYLEQSLALTRESKNRRGESGTLTSIGNQYLLTNRFEKAIEYYQQALAIDREVKWRQAESNVLNNLGIAYTDLGNYEKSLEYNSQALAIAREVKNRINEGNILAALGDSCRSLGRTEEAIRYHEQAVFIARDVKAKDKEADALEGLMLDWKANSRPRLAIFYGKQAVNAYQEIRSNIQSLDRESQQSFIKGNEGTYRTLADLLISEGRLPEAEQVIRMLKEEEYFEFIRRDNPNAPQTDKAQLTPEEQALDKRYREIADQLASLGAERGALIDRKNRTPEEEKRLAKLDADLTVAGNAFQKFLDQLTTTFGSSRDASGKVFQLRESQGMMEDLRELGNGVVAIYTLVGEDKYRVILTTSDFQKGYEYPIKGSDLNRKVLEFREVLQNPKLDPLPLARELYKILIGPVAKDLAKTKAQTIMWSLDGVLRYVPMAALNDGQHYLVESYQNVVFTPASQARLKDLPSRNWNVLGLGVTKAHGDRIPALPGVMEEMHGIIREAGEIKRGGVQSGVLPGTIKLDEAFTQESMLSGLRQRPLVVHVASHFQFSPGNETNSALLLGDGSFLSLAQIKSLPNVFGGVELLTLSACNTATGGSGANGTEVEGFGVLAQRQGAKAVIASLWPVFDTSTKVLMQEFYRVRESNNGVTKIEALRQAQLELLRGTQSSSAVSSANARQIVHEDPKPGVANRPLFKVDPKAPYAHPYYWAPFILIGNWR